MTALRLRHHELRLDDGPLVMGIVNASPDSFSDGAQVGDLDAQVRRAIDQAERGADLLDIGGQSGVTGVPELAAEEEIGRVAPLVERLAAEVDVPLSVDTYKPAVAEAAIAAGAALINDVSGLRYPEVADICARTGAGLVVMHNRAAPKQRLTEAALYDDVTGDVRDFLAARLDVATAAGVRSDALVLDPGPDFSKTPAQTVEVLRRLDEVRRLGHPVLLALSRKDFIGAVTGRRPRERLAGTLAAIGVLGDAPSTILRVHDVSATRDYLTVRRVLTGRVEVPAELRLDLSLRREPSA